MRLPVSSPTDMKRIFKRLRELRYRIHNTRYWLARGLPIRTAWKKADLTL